MCASRDYMEGYNKAVEDARVEIDRYKEALKRIADADDSGKWTDFSLGLQHIAQDALKSA